MNSHKKIIIALLLLGIGIGLVNVFLMPPFMNPDEVQHFMFAANYAYAGDEAALKRLDGDVLQLLKDYKWFHFIGVGPGWQNTADIKEIYFLNYFAREKRSISKSYFHLVYGKLLKLTGIKDTLRAFYFMRLLSFFLYLLIFLLCYFFYKRYFPGLWVYMIGGQLLIFQLGTILNSVNYDVLLTLLGVIFFGFAYRFIVSDERWILFGLAAAAASASLVKTAGLLFVLYFFILLLFKYRLDVKFLKRFVFALFLFVIVFSWFNYLFPERFFTLYSVLFAKLRSLTAAVGNGAGANIGFFDSIFDSFYFYTGWMGFKLAGLWYMVLGLFLLLPVIGVTLHIARTPVKKNDADSCPKKWLLYALVVTVVHLAAIRFYYGSGLMAQGRYLYPLLIPILTFIYCGIRYAGNYLKLKRDYLLIFYIIFQVVFFLFCLVRVISVFYLELPSPHAGL
ncbi:MAG: hypothetical protein GY950_20115 [bacterium]|nr:hypothetical protein [bacterium]